MTDQVGEERLVESEIVTRGERRELRAGRRRLDRGNVIAHRSAVEVALEVPGNGVVAQQLGLGAQRDAGAGRRVHGHRRAARAGGEIAQVGRRERVGERDAAPGARHRRQQSVRFDDGLETRPGEGRHVPPERLRRVDAGEERGLAGAALRQAARRRAWRPLR